MRAMSYRPQEVRQVLIPKEGKAGATRSLGISNFEDKVVQKMTQRVLDSIYEPLYSRSQRKSFTWEQFMLFIKANPLPKARVCCKLY